MRLYNGKLIKAKTGRQIAQAQELRNAVVVDVFTEYRYCRVKIQGSATHIKAWYPENWESTPNYLKPGNAVLITSPGGNRGRIEVSGNGILLPTTTANAPVIPTPVTPPDCVLTGCTPRPSIPSSMNVKLETGTYRIAGTTYTIVPMSMDRTDIVMDRYDIIMDELGDSVPFDAASATLYRYDSAVVGADGVIDVVKGTGFAATGTIPDPPAAPANHVRLFFVLIPPNATSITGAEINKLFVTPAATMLSASVADDELSWSELSTTLSISIKDQYNNYAVPPSGGWVFTIAWTKGNGTLSYGAQATTESASLTINHTGTGPASVTYTRNKTAGDISPIFAVREANNIYGMSIAYIQLLDSAGNKLP